MQSTGFRDFLGFWTLRRSKAPLQSLRLLFSTLFLDFSFWTIQAARRCLVSPCLDSSRFCGHSLSPDSPKERNSVSCRSLIFRAFSFPFCYMDPLVSSLRAILSSGCGHVCPGTRLPPPFMRRMGMMFAPFLVPVLLFFCRAHSSSSFRFFLSRPPIKMIFFAPWRRHRGGFPLLPES